MALKTSDETMKYARQYEIVRLQAQLREFQATVARLESEVESTWNHAWKVGNDRVTAERDQARESLADLVRAVEEQRRRSYGGPDAPVERQDKPLYDLTQQLKERHCLE